MTRFLLGAATMAGIWAAVEWFKNPMGHRGGRDPWATSDDVDTHHEFVPSVWSTYRGTLCERCGEPESAHEPRVFDDSEFQRFADEVRAPDIPRPRFLR